MVTFTGDAVGLDPQTAAGTTNILSGAERTLSLESGTRDPNILSGAERTLSLESGTRDPNILSGAERTLYPDTGLLVPGDFVGVDIVCRDPDGVVLDEVIRVMSGDKPAIPAVIDDTGRGTIRLLSDTYSEFIAVADYPDDPGVDIAWYSTDDTKALNPANIDLQKEHEVTLNPVEITSGEPSDYFYVSGKPVLVSNDEDTHLKHSGTSTSTDSE